MYFSWNRLVPSKATRDGVIPWKLFLVLHAQIRHLAGLERLTATQATVSAISMAFGAENAREIYDTLKREAMPSGTLVS